MDKLFNLNISYACRLYKVRTKLLDIMTAGAIGGLSNDHLHTAGVNFSSTRLFSVGDPVVSSRGKIVEDANDMRKKTSLNFRKKTMSLQSAK